MGRDSRSARHSLPTSKLNYNCIIEEYHDVEEAEAFRTHVLKLSDDLYDKQIRERFMYGALAAVWIVQLYWDIAKLSDVAYYIIKIILDGAIVLLSVGAYIAYQTRETAETAYWQAVFGPAYRD